MKRKRFPSNRIACRLGVSLVELLIAMTIGSAVMAMGLGLLHLMLQTEHTLAKSLQRRQTVSQLSQAFRQDVHAARSVESIPRDDGQEAAGLRLKLSADRQVRYTAKDHVIRRVETEGEKTRQRAEFRFSAGSVISFQTETPPRVALVIESPNKTVTRNRQSGSDVPTRKLTIQATLGRDHRFLEAD